MKYFIALILTTISMLAHAVPQTMSYQGVLPKDTVSPLSMEVRILDSPSGGALLWN